MRLHALGVGVDLAFERGAGGADRLCACGQVLCADQIAFHLTDWSSDAAFIVALHLFPERFTSEEIEAGVGLFLCHVPIHVIAAARLAGHQAEDLFRDGDTVA
jgi:hypothetical protein